MDGCVTIQGHYVPGDMDDESESLHVIPNRSAAEMVKN